MKSDWRRRLREIGKDAYIREEMTRLGFWPPSEEAARDAAAAEARLRTLYEELAAARKDLGAVEAEIAAAGDMPALLQEIRRRRIERVRADLPPDPAITARPRWPLDDRAAPLIGAGRKGAKA